MAFFGKRRGSLLRKKSKEEMPKKGLFSKKPKKIMSDDDGDEMPSMKESSISPDPEEFDNMMSEAVNSKKKKGFGRKQFK